MRSVCSAMALVLLFAGLSACGSTPPADRPALKFAGAASPQGDDPFPNWPAPPDVLESEVRKAFDIEDFQVMEEQKTVRGTGGSEKVIISFPGLQRKITFKWKEALKDQLDGSNNSPRREMAAYEIQKLFLTPEDYVVPTNGMHCEPLAAYAREHEKASATVRGTRCVLGNLSLWLQDVKVPQPLYEESRFVENPNYAYFMSNLNVLTYLIGHRDAREGNFVVSKDEQRPQFFSIDNGISFRAFPYNFFVENWDVIRIPAVRRDSVDRLRTLKRKDLDHLGVLTQLEADAQGRLIDVPAGRNLSPNKGARVQNGTVQFGLSKTEIDQLWARIQALIAKVDSGDLPVF